MIKVTVELQGWKGESRTESGRKSIPSKGYNSKCKGPEGRMRVGKNVAR